MSEANDRDEHLQAASVWRRVAAMLYDSVLLAGILLVAATPPVLLNGGAINDGTALGEIKNILFFIYLLCVIGFFYSWCWTHGGQTLGMTAWKIRVTQLDNSKVSWRQACLRCLTAIFGFANLSALFDAHKRGWHEHISKTKTSHFKKMQS